MVHRLVHPLVRRFANAATVLLAVLLGLSGGLASGLGVSPAQAAKVVPPPVNVPVSYQLGDPYQPEFGFGIVIRDRTFRPVSGFYNVCYLNGFQTQAEQTGWWKRTHRSLLLRKNGRYVVDGQWNEVLLDTSTDTKRRAIARVLGGWIDSCARKGYSAVEFDNLDSYQRSRGRLTKSHNVAMAKLLVARAHRKGLAAGQKNASELGSRGRRTAKFDFAIAEECERYRECAGYLAVYGSRVIEVEYTDYPPAVFARACAARGSRISVILRDRLLLKPGGAGYRYESC